MLKLINKFFITNNWAQKNLTPKQLQTFLKYIETIQDEKQIKLIGYLVQKIKPSSINTSDIIFNQIKNETIKSNQDLEYAFKLIVLYPIIQQYLEHYNKSIENQRMNSYIHQIQSQYPKLTQLQQLQIVQTIYPNCTIQLFTQQKPIKQQIYQKIQTFTPREIPEQFNDEEQLKQHQQITQGKIVLRFPPEPNGYLHLGHVRSIRLNFYSAEQLNGTCYLRYDDTNPVAEKQTYIDSIQQNVQWFGHQPTHITYASDYFDFLFNSAIQLIKEDKAFICEQTKEQMKESRKNKEPSPFRNRSKEDNLKLFMEMQDGKYPETKYTLRLKIDYKNVNPTLRDPVIYRVLFHSHPRSGNKWKVYPMYDFAHCICDSIEHITHSLCTLEFEIRRELYYWILNNLHLYKPIVYEFSRLNVSNNMLSKRKIAKLIELGIVKDWNDPRLLTLAGLQKRGYTPKAINDFIDTVSVPRGGNEHIISIKLLENCIRKELEKSVPKIIAIIDPIEIIIEETQQKLYIQQSDIKIQDQQDFYGLAPMKQVCLRYFGIIQCQQINQLPIRVNLITKDLDERKKMKGQINWISDDNYIEAIVNEYSYLFNIENPTDIQNYWEQINNNSLQVYKVFIPKNQDYKIGQRYQFERNGFYIIDSIDNGKIIFNKIVGLVEGEKKKLNK